MIPRSPTAAPSLVAPASAKLEAKNDVKDAVSRGAGSWRAGAGADPAAPPDFGYTLKIVGDLLPQLVHHFDDTVRDALKTGVQNARDQNPTLMD